jgi:hypothetical protein
MPWQNYDEAVEMLERRHQYFPQAFRWHGRRYEVDSIERCWQVIKRRRQPASPRQFFRVRCADGMFELYRDLEAGTWHMARARLAPAPVPVVRGLAPARW